MFDQINTYLDTKEPELLQFLKQIVLIQSGTYNKSGVDRVGQAVVRSLEAKQSLAALVLECGSLTEGVVTGRKGRIGFSLMVKGAAGHAAFADRQKKSAIIELSHKVIELESLNGLSPGLTVNVGKIQGGIGPNTVAEMASAEVDVRFVDPDESALFEAELRRIMEHAHIPGVETAALRRSQPTQWFKAKRTKNYSRWLPNKPGDWGLKS